MAELINEGTLSVTGTILHTGGTSATQLADKVLNLRFNNPAAYVLTLQIYNATTLATTTLYELTLSAGDTVTDSMQYALKTGDQLIATSDIPGTAFYVYGLIY
jgi:hypothetical protein